MWLSIQKEQDAIIMAFHDHYVYLKLAGPQATPAEITRAYRALALKLHPDKNRGNEKNATKNTVFLNSVYDILKTPHKKASYDESWRAAHQPKSRPSYIPKRSVPLRPEHCSNKFAYNDLDKMWEWAYAAAFDSCAFKQQDSKQEPEEAERRQQQRRQREAPQSSACPCARRYKFSIMGHCCLTCFRCLELGCSEWARAKPGSKAGKRKQTDSQEDSEEDSEEDRPSEKKKQRKETKPDTQRHEYYNSKYSPFCGCELQSKLPIDAHYCPECGDCIVECCADRDCVSLHPKQDPRRTDTRITRSPKIITELSRTYLVYG